MTSLPSGDTTNAWPGGRRVTLNSLDGKSCLSPDRNRVGVPAPNAAPTNLSMVDLYAWLIWQVTMRCNPMSVAAGNNGASGAIGGIPPAAATTMCQSSTSSTTSNPVHHDRDRSCADVRSAGGNLFLRLVASALMASSSAVLLRLIAPASSRWDAGTASSRPER